MTLRAFLFALLVTLVSPTQAGKIRWFNLHEKMLDRVFVCFTETNAKNLATFLVEDKAEEFMLLAAMTKAVHECGSIVEEVTYEEQVFRVVSRGNLFTVYRAAINGVTVYIPLVNFDHRLY